MGSIFYGVILGIFLCGSFFIKHVGGNAVFWAALGEVQGAGYLPFTTCQIISFLWLKFDRTLFSVVGLGRLILQLFILCTLQTAFAREQKAGVISG
jgi:hypothetical protein